jgi:hypothetical protein
MNDGTKDQMLSGLSPEFLLAFLALTSKYHPTLIAHHSPSTLHRPSNPLFAADYYAVACKDRLQTSKPKVDLLTCQTHLMLAMHEWGNCQGLEAQANLTIAIELAQILGLQYMDTAAESNVYKTSIAVPEPSGQSESSSAADATSQEESRRRTLWSCVILERSMKAAIFRPLRLSSLEIGTQLPCSDRAFLFGEKVITKLFIETLDSKKFSEDTIASAASLSPLKFLNRSRDRDEDVADEIGIREPAISRYIRALDTLNAVFQYVGAGGRL